MTKEPQEGYVYILTNPRENFVGNHIGKGKRIRVAHNRCPRCGGRLVLRDGKYGDFYGCSNYPRCRFTRQP